MHLNTFQHNSPFTGDKKGLILPGSLHGSHSAIIHWAQEIIFPSISSFLMQPNRIWVPSFRNQFDLTNDSKSDIRPSCNLRSSQHVRGWFNFSWGFHQNPRNDGFTFVTGHIFMIKDCIYFKTKARRFPWLNYYLSIWKRGRIRLLDRQIRFLSKRISRISSCKERYWLACLLSNARWLHTNNANAPLWIRLCLQS